MGKEDEEGCPCRILKYGGNTEQYLCVQEQNKTKQMVREKNRHISGKWEREAKKRYRDKKGERIWNDVLREQ